MLTVRGIGDQRGGCGMERSRQVILSKVGLGPVTMWQDGEVSAHLHDGRQTCHQWNGFGGTWGCPLPGCGSVSFRTSALGHLCSPCVSCSAWNTVFLQFLLGNENTNLPHSADSAERSQKRTCITSLILLFITLWCEYVSSKFGCPCPRACWDVSVLLDSSKRRSEKQVRL